MAGSLAISPGDVDLFLVLPERVQMLAQLGRSGEDIIGWAAPIAGAFKSLLPETMRLVLVTIRSTPRSSRCWVAWRNGCRLP